jgi:hypothetical protein
MSNQKLVDDATEVTSSDAETYTVDSSSVHSKGGVPPEESHEDIRLNVEKGDLSKDMQVEMCK